MNEEGSKPKTGRNRLRSHDALILAKYCVQRWCAIQGSNLQHSPATAGIEGMASPIDSPQLSPDSELVEISAAWAKLPDALRAGILAIIRSANPDPSIAR